MGVAGILRAVSGISRISIGEMPSNIEIKARLRDRDRAIRVAKQLSGNEGMRIQGPLGCIIMTKITRYTRW